MCDECDDIPVGLDYLCEPASRFGADWRRWAQPAVIERDADAWRQLAQLHDQIRRREDLPAIAAWLRVNHGEALAPSGRGDPDLISSAPGHSGPQVQSVRELDLRRQVRCLMRLLRELGKTGVKPFDQPVLRLPPSVDAAALRRQTPPRLRYLIRLARRMRLVPNELRLRRQTVEVSPRRFNDLARVADLIRRRNDGDAIQHWLEANDPTARRAAALVAALLRMMDDLEIF